MKDKAENLYSVGKMNESVFLWKSLLSFNVPFPQRKCTSHIMERNNPEMLSFMNTDTKISNEAAVEQVSMETKQTMLSV